MRVRTTFATLLGAVLLVGALVYAFQSNSEQIPHRQSSTTLVKVQPVSSTIAKQEVRFSAITRAKHHAVLSFSIPARMTSRPVEIGDKVEAGQILASLDFKEFDNAVKSAEAAVTELEVRLAQAGRDNRRYKQLNQGQAVAASKAEQISATYLQLQAALAGARVKLAEARRLRQEAELQAPFSGVINNVFLEPGEWAKPGQPIVELIDTTKIELEVEVPETVIGHLFPKQRVDIRLPFIGNTLIHGTIDHLAKASMGSGRLFPVLIVLEKTPKLIPGMTAELIVDIDSRPALLVPISAVINPGGSRPSVFILEDDHVREVHVQLGGFVGKQVLVTGDLSVKDRVVVSGQTTLADGKRVEVAL